MKSVIAELISYKISCSLEAAVQQLQYDTTDVVFMLQYIVCETVFIVSVFYFNKHNNKLQ